MKYSAGVFAKLSITRCQKCTGHDVLYIFALIILDFLGDYPTSFAYATDIDLLLLNDTKTYYVYNAKLHISNQ